MKRLKVLFVVLLIANVTVMQAAVYKGQREYIKKCRACHFGGEQIAQKETQKTWRNYFAKKGKKLAAVHIGSERVKDQLSSLHLKKKAKKLNVKKVDKYFKGKKFKKRSRHLRDFFVEYAKDSGNVPACN